MNWPKFCTYVSNRLIMKFRKFQLDSINVSRVIKIKPIGTIGFINRHKLVRPLQRILTIVRT